jgi:hypothetical protein
MNLQSGAEREVELPRGAGTPSRIGWTQDGLTLVVRAGRGLYRGSAPPAQARLAPVAAAERPAAESTLAVLLGRPVFARVVSCATPGDLCVASDTGAPGPLAIGARDPLRWGDDSVAFFVGNAVEIRPVGPGRARRLAWESEPGRVREMTVFLGGRASEQ